MKPHPLQSKQHYSIQSSNWTAGVPGGGQQSTGRLSSHHSQHQPQPLLPKPPLGGIHVPEDYDIQDNQQMVMQQKEKFFESLGLPPNLSDNTIKAYNAQSQPQLQASADAPLDDSSLFKSCNNNVQAPQSFYTAGGSHSNLFPGGPLQGPVYSGLPSNQKSHPHQTSYKSAMMPQQIQHPSDNSFLTAFDAAQSLSASGQDQVARFGVASSAQQPKSYVHHNDSVSEIMRGPEEMKKFEDMLVDSQRNMSAPVNMNNQRIDYSQKSQKINNNIGQSQRSQQQLQRREILTITVDIGDPSGQTANILICEGDDPRQLANEFAARHGIQSEQLKELLAEQIQLNVDAVIIEEEELQKAAQYTGLGGGSLDQRKKEQYQQPGMLNKLSSATLGNHNTQSDNASSSRGPQFMQLHQVPLERLSDSSNNLSYVGGGGGGPMSIHTTADALYYNQQQQQLNTPLINNSFAAGGGSNQFLRQSMQNRTGSYGRMPLVNSSFVSESVAGGYGTIQNSQGIQQPGSQTYEQWKENVSQQLRSHRANQPVINDNSRRIIEHKRQLNNTANITTTGQPPRSSSGSVHQRLHQQAVSKQRQHLGLPPRTANPFPPHPLNLLPNNPPTTRNDPRKSFNLNSTSPNPRPRPSSSSPSHAPKDLINYGERLYQKGVKRKEEQIRMLNQVKLQIESETLARDCSFRPSINHISRMIAQRDEGVKAEEALIRYGKESRERIEQKRSEQLFSEIEGCRFRPELRAKQTTERLLRSRYQTAGGYESDGAERQRQGGSDSRNGNQGYQSNSADKFGDLYQDAMRRRERQDKIYSACIGSECTFQPDTTVSKYYYQRLESRDPGYQAHKQQQQEASRYVQPSQSRGLHHFRNLSEGLNEKERLQRSLKKSSTFSNDLKDPDSGLPFFHPRVGRGPRNQARPSPKKLPLMLYNQSKALKDKLDFKKRFLEQELDQHRKKVHTTDRSKYIIEELKIAHFSDIFRKMDSDGDGQISCQQIDLSQVEPEVLGVLEQIFGEMEEMGQALTEEEWVEACCRLHEVLSLPQKRVLFNPKDQASRRGGQQSKQGKGGCGPTYRPKLDPNSMRIAEQRRTGEDVAEVLMRKKKEYEQRVLEKKQEKENMELVGCTFHPNIIQSPASTSSAGGGGQKMQSRVQQLPSAGQTQPVSRSSYAGSIQNLAQQNNTVSRTGPYNNNQGSFYGGINQSQHTATFQGQREYTNNTQTSGAGGATGFFDLNNLAYNVASEYLRPNANLGMGGNTFTEQPLQQPLSSSAAAYYRPPSVTNPSQINNNNPLLMKRGV